MHQVVPLFLESPPGLKLGSTTDSPTVSYYTARDRDSVDPSHHFDFSTLPHKQDQWLDHDDANFRRPNDKRTSVMTRASSYYAGDYYNSHTETANMVCQPAPFPMIHHGGALASPVSFTPSTMGPLVAQSSIESFGSGTNFLSPISYQSRSSKFDTTGPLTEWSTSTGANGNGTPLSSTTNRELDSAPVTPRLVHIRDFNTLSYTSNAEDDRNSIDMFNQDRFGLQENGYRSSSIQNSSPRPSIETRSSPLSISQERYPSVFGGHNEHLPYGTSGAFPIKSDDKPNNASDSTLNKILPARPAPAFMPHMYRPPSQQPTRKPSGASTLKVRTTLTPEPEADHDFQRSSGVFLVSEPENPYLPRMDAVGSTDVNSADMFQDSRHKDKPEMSNPYSHEPLLTSRSGNRQNKAVSGLFPSGKHPSRQTQPGTDRLSISSTSMLIADSASFRELLRMPLHYMQQNRSFVHSEFSYNLDPPSSRSFSNFISSDDPIKISQSNRKRDLDFIERVSRPNNNISSASLSDAELNATVEGARSFIESEYQSSKAPKTSQKINHYNSRGKPIYSPSLEIFLLCVFVLFPPFWLLLGAGFFDMAFNPVSRKTKKIALALAGSTFILVIIAAVIGLALRG